MSLWIIAKKHEKHINSMKRDPANYYSLSINDEYTTLDNDKLKALESEN